MIAKTLQDMFRRYRRPGDIVFAFLFFGFSLFLLSQIGAETQAVKRTKWFAQPALWPKIAIWGMVLFSGLHLLGSFLSPRIPGRLREVTFWLMSLEYVAYFLIYVVAVPWLGYLTSTMLFAALLTIRLGFRLPGAFCVALGFGAVVAVVFRALLQVNIPAGRIYEYLPDGLRAFALTYL
ncbi:tripartite tricarboxylate transporter TctB family protein [Ruegeria sp. HKCCD6119]|uniref:tripartite tricarboxylate transporter TctB family protein n=1 Tax=Ruegeria sp. HKCCD6119 TaxID=2683003 RepID=UPI00149273DA|nr:tripartite tricarboxylate transporter TctB family protein [Ruegeria sp. HKCCD6119]NOD85303.1 tripartite tricarboxylate transporter TctB family protein [Ruegeria sp. HKCCD6119]